MTRKSSKGKRTTKQSKRLSLTKHTLKDLSVHRAGPAGGKKQVGDERPSYICKVSARC